MTIMKKQQQEIKTLLNKNEVEWPEGLQLAYLLLQHRLTKQEIVVKWIFYNKPDTAFGLLKLIRNV